MNIDIFKFVDYLNNTAKNFVFVGWATVIKFMFLTINCNSYLPYFNLKVGDFFEYLKLNLDIKGNPRLLKQVIAFEIDQKKLQITHNESTS